MVLSGAMSDAARKDYTQDDPKHRLISIFVGAVLLPSLALSYVAIDFVQRLATARKDIAVKRAEDKLYYIEKQLSSTAQTRAKEAARVVGIERLVDGRAEVIRGALMEAGMPELIFESLHLEGPASRLIVKHRVEKASKGNGELPRELLTALESLDATEGEDTVAWTGEDGRTVGTLRFKFACGYVHGQLIRDYFETDFGNPEQSLIVRVSEPDGSIIYESAATPDGKFEVTRADGDPVVQGAEAVPALPRHVDRAGRQHAGRRGRCA